MKRGIVAIDNNRGLANEKGIPWHLPKELEYYRSKTKSGVILMGYLTYLEMKKPLHEGPDYVATKSDEPLREGFIQVRDPRKFLIESTDDVWNVGGASMMKSTYDLLDELYVTQIDADFGTTRIMPDFRKIFTLAESSDPIIENGVSYRFQIWKNTLRQP